VTVGGSATTDGGAGAIAAIRAAGGPGAATLTVVCDVLTTFERAAIVYGPQKGADRATVGRLTERLERCAGGLPRDPRGVPMTGAAGGLSGGLWAAFGAELVPGAPWVLDAIGFDDLLRGARAVIAGEGRLDEQTFEGKIVGEIAARGARAGVPVHAVVGSSSLSPERAAQLGVASVREAGTADAMAASGHVIARELLASDEV
jgi:glycerate kinase